MKLLPRRLVLLLALSFAGIAQGAEKDAGAEKPVSPVASEASAAASAKAQDSGLTSQVLYQFLLAEVAAARGKTSLAASAMTALARSTHDLAIARRATEIAFFGRQSQQAVDASRLWLELDPSSDEARQTLWTLLAATGQVDELSKALAAVLETEGPAIGSALLSINRLFVRVQDKAAVQKVITQVTTPYLSMPEARYARALAAVSAGDEPGARAEIGEALRLKPDWEAATLFKAQLQASKPEDALATIDQLLAHNKDPKSYNDARFTRARLLVDLKRYKDARNAFDQLLDAQPDNPELIYASGLLALQVGDASSGQKRLRRLLDMDFADKDSVRLYLGQAAEDQGKLDEAIAFYDAIGAAHPRYVMAQARIASVLHARGKDDEALEHLHLAQSANPKEKLDLVLAEVQLLSDKNKNAQAYEVLDKALIESPDDPVLLYEASIVAERLSKFDVLERNLRRLIQLKPDYAQAYNALGYSFADRNVKLEEATQLLDKALSLAPEDPFILDSRGWLDYRLGRLPEAEVLLRKATSLRSDAEFAAHLGEVLWVQGKQDDAKQIWDAAAKTDPTNDLLNSTRKRLQH
ncbi:MAG TPA: tetratricopeptide repeat protein [Rhodocyclaceae bacterium]|nr:tetratricopeptide repeat protein [Rhodocyclaceae bacterium]